RLSSRSSRVAGYAVASLLTGTWFTGSVAMSRRIGFREPQPAPYQSGETAHDQGITRAGNKHVRRLMVQLAWTWLRYQPTSALSHWYQRRFGRGSRRLRRIGIVAVARKLLIAVWRYVEHGVIPEGAVLKSEVA